MTLKLLYSVSVHAARRTHLVCSVTWSVPSAKRSTPATLLLSPTMAWLGVESCWRRGSEGCTLHYLAVLSARLLCEHLNLVHGKKALFKLSLSNSSAFTPPPPALLVFFVPAGNQRVIRGSLCFTSCLVSAVQAPSSPSSSLL